MTTHTKVPYFVRISPGLVSCNELVLLKKPVEERDRERERAVPGGKTKCSVQSMVFQWGKNCTYPFLLKQIEVKKKKKVKTKFILTGFFELHVIGVQSKNRNLNLGCPT